MSVSTSAHPVVSRTLEPKKVDLWQLITERCRHFAPGFDLVADAIADIRPFAERNGGKFVACELEVYLLRKAHKLDFFRTDFPAHLRRAELGKRADRPLADTQDPDFLRQFPHLHEIRQETCNWLDSIGNVRGLIALVRKTADRLSQKTDASADPGVAGKLFFDDAVQKAEPVRWPLANDDGREGTL